MDTPICDFVHTYCHTAPLRLHMPGHKGITLLGMESMDITEIPGADSLYEASGIIQRSEDNASRLFGCQTFYSTEGSSLCIRAMLHLTMLHAGKKPVIAAARNVHRSFLSAAALLDLDIRWLYPREPDSYLSCQLDPDDLEDFLVRERPTAVYLTSPDYLGNLADIARMAQLCHRHGTLLLVDNAHGAYLRFLNPSLHPITLGADICCDSGHKTLPALTGGAYLHISNTTPSIFREQAKNSLALFGSTSPSYLILQSLDYVNKHLVTGYRHSLKECVRQTQQMKEELQAHGYDIPATEPLKITIRPKSYGYTGLALAEVLQEKAIYCEFADPDHLVLMISPELGEYGLMRVQRELLEIPPRPAIRKEPPAYHRCEPVMSVREATLSPCRTIPVEHALGKILAAPSVGCPPAVPIVISGERIDREAIERFQYYGIHKVTVVDDY